MARPCAEVEEEPPVGVDGAQVGEKLDGTVGQIGTQVIALVDRTWWTHSVIVVVQRGDELVRLATVEAVPAVEAAPERPRGTRTGHVGLVIGSEMPFAHGVGRVAVRPQHL
jgi:hypothetical protein